MTAGSFGAVEIDTFRRDGFFAPLDVFSAAEVGRLRQQLEAFERSLPPGPVAPRDRRKLHVRLPWMRDLVEDPRLLDSVEGVLGPDILVFTSTFFIKEAESDAIAAWHQDATFFGLEPPELIAAWIALSDASIAAGCMRFVAGSHRWGQLRHAANSVAASVNAGAQSIAEAFESGSSVHAPLAAGQVSLHHSLTVHDSAPNWTGDRRIGLSISYLPASVRRDGMRLSATLVRGTDRFGHFDPEPDPRRLAPDERVAAHALAYQRYRAGYEEQMARHAQHAA
jgi:Phytanoyl-CoA dioxygenase (PhyH)